MISITITLSFYLSHNHRHKTILKQHNDTPTTTSTDPEVIQESINIQIAEHEVNARTYCYNIFMEGISQLQYYCYYLHSSL